MLVNIDLDEARELMGAKLPSKGPLPAAWWLTTDSEQIAAYDRWHNDYEAHLKKVRALAESLGLDPSESVYIGSGFSSLFVAGFQPPIFMGHWNHEHPEYRPTPDGWRIDKKTGYLLSIRRTKKDRESQANRDFYGLQKIPSVWNYLSGLPKHIEIDDRDGGGTWYGMNYRRGAKCVWAYSGGDPDRQPDKRDNEKIDAAVWQRMPLSILAKLMEEKAERLAVDR